jgi:hypothetical protein
MSGMPDLDVRASGEHAYDVTVTADDGSAREYHLTVPESWLDGLQAEHTDEPTLVRCVLELLLEQEGSRMPAEFSLAEVDAVYPGFDERLRTALRPPS